MVKENVHGFNILLISTKMRAFFGVKNAIFLKVFLK